MLIAAIPNDLAVLIKLVEKPGSTTGNPGASTPEQAKCTLGLVLPGFWTSTL